MKPSKGVVQDVVHSWMLSLGASAFCARCWQVTVYTIKYHILIISGTYPSFMHHGGNLENNFH
jgi:hypothetical protein